MSAGGGGTTGLGVPSVDEAADGDQLVADLPDLTWAFWSRPRKSSDESSATRRWQESHVSRCLLTDADETSSSLPRPYDCNT